jgi:hypothetical protein
MKKKVSYAKLHGGDSFIPGIGGLGNTLDPNDRRTGSKTMDMEMYYTEFGLEWTIKRGGKKFEGVFPHANIQIAVYEQEDTHGGGTALALVA